MRPRKQKVIAYITSGPRLLVFRHRDFPAAGIQVPAGTIKPGELPQEAALREALEETGLPDLRLAAYLGEEELDMTPFGIEEIHHRYTFHLVYRGETPDTWEHAEIDPSSGDPGPIVFAFFWAELPGGVPELAGGQGHLLPGLVLRL